MIYLKFIQGIQKIQRTKVKQNVLIVYKEYDKIHNFKFYFFFHIRTMCLNGNCKCSTFTCILDVL